MNYIGFADMVDQLAQALEVELIPDANGALQIIVDESIAVQIEPNETDERILLGSSLYELPPGKYRADVLKSALIHNGLAQPPLETLCYIEQKGTLALFRYLPTKHLTVEKLLLALSNFITTASDWIQALESGHSAPVKTYLAKDAKPSPFDLK